MYVYMAVTVDEYELPVAIADTIVALAKMMNTTDTAIRSSLYQEKIGRIKKARYKKVWINDA